MNSQLQKMSANQQYRLSGSTLPFKEWLNREKEKGEVIPKSGVTDVIYGSEVMENNITGGVTEEVKKDEGSSNTILGLSKPILMLSALVIVGAVAYKYYKRK